MGRSSPNRKKKQNEGAMKKEKVSLPPFPPFVLFIQNSSLLIKKRVQKQRPHLKKKQKEAKHTVQ
jgi:hypothetical protein